MIQHENKRIHVLQEDQTGFLPFLIFAVFIFLTFPSALIFFGFISSNQSHSTGLGIFMFLSCGLELWLFYYLIKTPAKNLFKTSFDLEKKEIQFYDLTTGEYVVVNQQLFDSFSFVKIGAVQKVRYNYFCLCKANETFLPIDRFLESEKQVPEELKVVFKEAASVPTKPYLIENKLNETQLLQWREQEDSLIVSWDSTTPLKRKILFVFIMLLATLAFALVAQAIIPILILKILFTAFPLFLSFDMIRTLFFSAEKFQLSLDRSKNILSLDGLMKDGVKENLVSFNLSSLIGVGLHIRPNNFYEFYLKTNANKEEVHIQGLLDRLRANLDSTIPLLQIPQNRLALVALLAKMQDFLDHKVSSLLISF